MTNGKVEKKDGTEAADFCNVTRFKLSRNDGKSINVVAIPSFAKQGVPLESYARKAFTDEEKQILKDMLSKPASSTPEASRRGSCIRPPRGGLPERYPSRRRTCSGGDPHGDCPQHAGEKLLHDGHSRDNQSPLGGSGETCRELGGQPKLVTSSQPPPRAGNI